MDTTAKSRTLREIAQEIQENWKPKVYFGAVPYLAAMRSLTTIDGMYGADSAVEIVMYFLANANTWRGDVARRVKAELKAMLKTKGY